MPGVYGNRGVGALAITLKILVRLFCWDKIALIGPITKLWPMWLFTIRCSEKEEKKKKKRKYNKKKKEKKKEKKEHGRKSVKNIVCLQANTLWLAVDCFGYGQWQLGT